MGYAGVGKALSNRRCLGQEMPMGGPGEMQKGDKKLLQGNNSLKLTQPSLQLAYEYA